MLFCRCPAAEHNNTGLYNLPCPVPVQICPCSRYNKPCQQTTRSPYTEPLISTCDRRVKEAAYLGLVRPLLEYASQDWDPYTDNLSNEIEKTQRRTARFVTSDYQNYELGSVTTLLKDLGCKSLKNRREVDRLCPLKKGLDNNAILSLDELSKPARKTTHMHNTYYTTIYVRTNIFKFSFVPRIIRDWNNKPHNVVEIADDAKFRKLFLFTILQKSADPRCK